MIITLQQTGIANDIGEQQCCICRRRFHMGTAMCWAIDESNVLYGQVCHLCIHRGPEHIQSTLEHDAWWARVIAQQQTEASREGITDCPTLDEVLVAEAFYERAAYDTADEYMDALDRGEIQ